MSADLSRQDRSSDSRAASLLEVAHNAAHDLRSPLNTLTNIAQLFARKYAEQTDEEGAQLLRMLEHAARDMRRLIDNLVFYADAVAAETSDQAANAEEVLAATISALQKKIQESAAEVTHSSLPRVKISDQALARIFENVIDNAILFRNAGAKPDIRISAARANELWRFAIADNGPGIAPEYQKIIFEPLKKLEPTGESGSGLGLSIVKVLVERYGGQVWVESEPGKGSTFYFTLPAVT